jgi:hypothetical protein
LLQRAEELLDGGRTHALLLLLRSRNQAAQAAAQRQCSCERSEAQSRPALHSLLRVPARGCICNAAPWVEALLPTSTFVAQ